MSWESRWRHDAPTHGSGKGPKQLAKDILKHHVKGIPKQRAKGNVRKVLRNGLQKVFSNSFKQEKSRIGHSAWVGVP